MEASNFPDGHPMNMKREFMLYASARYLKFIFFFLYDFQTDENSIALIQYVVIMGFFFVQLCLCNRVEKLCRIRKRRIGACRG